MDFDVPGDCSGKMCGYSVFNGDLGCESGSGSCWVANLVEANTSVFHDEVLQDATLQIKAILEGIPADPEGRKLSFVHTEHGTMLGWVRHGVTQPNGKVTFDSGAERVKEALGLRLDPPAQAS